MKNNGFGRKIIDFIDKLPIYSIITLLTGLWLLIFPERALEVALRISGLLLVVYALYRFIAVFVLETDIFESSVSLFSTVITLTLGILLLANPLFITVIVSTLFGVYLIISGLFALWRYSVLKEHYEIFGVKEDRSSRSLRFVTAIITLILGLVLVIFPLAAEKFTAIVTGICLTVESIKSIALKFKELRRTPRTHHTNEIEAEFVDKSDNG